MSWMCGPSQLPQQQCSRTRSRGMPSSAVLMAAMCSSQHLRRTRASLWSWNVMVRSMARSGASICRIRPASWMAQVLGAHLARERHQVGLVAVVVGVHHGGGDDAGRRRRHERLGERRAGRRGAALEAGDLLLDVLGVEIAHLADRLRRVGDLGALGEAAQEHLDQLRHLLEVLADLALGFAAEARHALRGCRSGSRRAAARRRCRCRCRPRPARRRCSRTARSISAAMAARRRSPRRPRGGSAGRSAPSLRGRLPTCVVRMRSRLWIIAPPRAGPGTNGDRSIARAAPGS